MCKQTKKVDLSIISPAYNEEESIFYFLSELYSVIEENKLNAEVIIVDDGSEDKTSKIVEENYKDVILIKNKENLGQQASIIEGLKNSKGDKVVVLDSDLQDPPKLIPKLLKRLEKHDVVFARRKKRNDGLFKKVTAFLYYRIVKFFFGNIALDCGDFFAARRVVIERTISQNGNFLVRFSVANFANKIGYLDYERGNRKHGKSSYNLVKMLNLAILGLKTQKARYKAKVCIIGGGFQGLVLAYLAQKKGYSVTVFEKEKEVGGLLREVVVAGSKIERTYHHIFRTDFYLLRLFNSLKISDISWKKIVMKNYTGNPGQFLKTEEYLKKNIGSFTPFRFYIGILLTVFLGARNESSKELVEKYFGEKIWQKYFSVIFQKKFSEKFSEISSKWFVSRIRKRFFAQTLSGEVLGYPQGGFGNVVKKLEAEIKKSGRVITGVEVGEILEKDFGYIVSNEFFDVVIDTRPPKDVEYYKYEGVIVKTRSKVGDFFWANNLSKDPVTAFINISKLAIGKDNLHYIGRYVPQSNRRSAIDSKNELISIFKRAYNLSQKDILGSVYTSDDYAQPIFTQNHKKLPQKIKSNYYALSMAHIYPEDRGLNEAIKYAKRLVKSLP